MTETTHVVRGTILPDGTLELAEPLNLPAGTVEVTVRSMANAPRQGETTRPNPPAEFVRRRILPLPRDPRTETLWQSMQRTRAELEAAGHEFRTKEEIDADIEDLRDWDGKVEAVYRQAEEERERVETEIMLNYVDSVILIYYYDHIGHFQARASRWIGSFLSAGDVLAVSDLVRMECRVMPIRLGNMAILATFDRFFADPDVHQIPLTAAVFNRAAEIRAGHRFKTPDSLHLAAAIESGCDRFLTHDARLARFTGIPVEILAVNLPRDPSILRLLGRLRGSGVVVAVSGRGG